MCRRSSFQSVGGTTKNVQFALNLSVMILVTFPQYLQ